MRRAVYRRSATGMSLFPFLAVLICTMGALIVLLVMVLQQARVQASSAPPATAPSAEQSAEERKLRESKEDSDWRREMLMKQRNDQANELSNTRKELSHLEDHIRRLQEQAKQIDDQVAELQKLGESGSQDQAGLNRELARLLAQIDAAKIQLEEAKKKAKTKPGSYAIIPYQGPNGTKRRPIYIECAEEGITIYPENIMLQDADFQGPLGPGNPLDAALRTIREYIAKTGDPKKDGEPYPLLLVRPNGTRAYSAARSAMKSWDDEFGYELIDGEMVLKFPPADPVLEELLLRTLRDARSRQMALAAAMPTRFKQEESQGLVTSPRGGFAAAGGADGEGTSMSGGRGPSGRGSFGPGGNGAGTSGGGYGPSGSGGYGGSRLAQSGTGRGGAGTGGFGTVTHTSGSQTPGGQSYGGTGGGFGQSGGQGGSAGQGNAGQGSTGQGGTGYGGTGFGGTSSGGAASGGNPGSNGAGPGNSADGGGTGPGGQGGTNNQGSGGNGGTGSQGSQGMGSTNGGNVDPIQSAGAGGGMGGAGGQTAQQGNAGANSLAVNGQSGAGSQNGSQSSGGQNGQNSSSGSSSNSSGGPGGGASSGSSTPTSSSSAGGSSASAMESMAKHKGHDWALKNKDSYSTGVTRPIRVQCFTDRLVILSEKGDTQRPYVVKLRDGYVRGSAEEFVAGIWKHMEPWGLAVQGGYWKPVLRVEVGPGADKQFAQLEAVLRDSGLDVVRK